MRQLLAIIAFFVGAAILASTAAHAGLAIDSQEASNAAHNSTSSPLTWSFTNTAGTKLVVCASVNNSSGSPTIGAVSYNGVAMTAISGATFTDATNIVSIKCFYLDSPATGSNTVSVAGSGMIDIIAGAISFTGAAAGAGGFGTAATANSTTNTTPATVAVTGTLNGDIVLGAATAGNSFSSFTSPTTKSALLNVSSVDGGNNFALTQQSTSGGSATISDTLSAANPWDIVGFEVIAAPATAHPLGALGVGK